MKGRKDTRVNVPHFEIAGILADEEYIIENELMKFLRNV